MRLWRVRETRWRTCGLNNTLEYVVSSFNHPELTFRIVVLRLGRSCLTDKEEQFHVIKAIKLTNCPNRRTEDMLYDAFGAFGAFMNYANAFWG